MSKESKLFTQKPTDGYCPTNRAKGHAHVMSDWSLWARKPGEEKHPTCRECGYIDRSRILDSWKKEQCVK